MKITMEQRFWRKVDKTSDCWLWIGAVNEDGYGMFWNGSTCDLAHRVAWRLKHGEIPLGKCVLHECDTPACMLHLFVGTHQDNMTDAAVKGRKGKKLTTAEAAQIKALARRGEFHRSIAASFGIARRTVGDIVNGKIWRHVDAAL